jgi:hypothetical protein
MAVYLAVTGASLSVAMRNVDCLNVVAISVILLLIIGIRNAWDMTVWTIDHRQN